MKNSRFSNFYIESCSFLKFIWRKLFVIIHSQYPYLICMHRLEIMKVHGVLCISSNTLYPWFCFWLYFSIEKKLNIFSSSFTQKPKTVCFVHTTVYAVCTPPSILIWTQIIDCFVELLTWYVSIIRKCFLEGIFCFYSNFPS